MCIFFKNRVDFKSVKRAEKFYLDFLEGRISTKEFWEEYKESNIFQNVLKYDSTRWKKTYMLGKVKMRHFGKGPYDKNSEFNPDTLLDKCDINKLYDIYCLYAVISRYFIRRKIDFICGNEDVKLYLFLQKFVPSYVEIYDGEYLKEIFDSTQKDISKNERLKQAKARLLEIYSFEKYPPRWIQPPEWPIDEDGPLVFSYQKIGSGRCLYYFYNKKRPNKQIVVEQFE